MQQVAQYLAGERDYTLIKGGTGPLVYPAAHVYIYTALYRLTERGRNIAVAQALFAGLYVGILAVVMGCYRMAKVCVSFVTRIAPSGGRDGGSKAKHGEHEGHTIMGHRRKFLEDCG